MQDEDGQDQKRQVGSRIDASSSKEVLVEVDAFAVVLAIPALPGDADREALEDSRRDEADDIQRAQG